MLNFTSGWLRSTDRFHVSRLRFYPVNTCYTRGFMAMANAPSKYIQPKTKLWHHIDRLAAIREGQQPAPVNVEIDLSNRCQMGCSFCAFAYTHSKGPLAKRNTHDTGDLMDTNLAMQIIDQLAEAGVRSITWSGGVSRMKSSVKQSA